MRAWSIIVGCGALVAAGWTMGCDPPTVPRTPESAPDGAARPADTASSGSPLSHGSPSSSGATAGAPPLLDFATLTKAARSLDRARVRVVGTTFEGTFELDFSDGRPTVRVMAKRCTRLGCSKASPCCNRCSSALSLRGTELVGVRLVDKAQPTRFSCGGNECSMTCTPGAGRYEAIGTFRLGPDGELDLEVETIDPLP